MRQRSTARGFRFASSAAAVFIGGVVASVGGACVSFSPFSGSNASGAGTDGGEDDARLDTDGTLNADASADTTVGVGDGAAHDADTGPLACPIVVSESFDKNGTFPPPGFNAVTSLGTLARDSFRNTSMPSALKASVPLADASEPQIAYLISSSNAAPSAVHLSYDVWLDTWPNADVFAGCILLLTPQGAPEDLLGVHIGEGQVSAALAGPTSDSATVFTNLPAAGFYNVTIDATGIQTGTLSAQIVVRQLPSGTPIVRNLAISYTPGTSATVSIECGLPEVMFVGPQTGSIDTWVDDIELGICQ